MGEFFAIGFDDGSQVEVNVPTRDALLESVDDALASGRGFSIATLNLDHLVKLRASDAFRRAYRQQTFVVADGNPIVWLSRLAGRRVSLVPGCELVEPLSALAANQDVSVALLGATEEALDVAAARLEAKTAGLGIAARIAPGQDFDPFGPEADACIERLRESGAGLCFLALGAPKQEVFAARARHLLPGVGFVSIGAGLDFLAGSQVRAPLWMRRTALEWLWRWANNPRRMSGRYALCLSRLPGLAAEALRLRMHEPVGQSAPSA